ncbi:MAG: Uncharacterised protein [Synechococcus sp. MIT S9220]|nr:MAG: Uncharacterised protein [Synechococcus sp. MIT S9220]
MTEIGDAQQKIEQTRRGQIGPFAGASTATPIGNPGHAEGHDRQRPISRRGAADHTREQIRPGDHGKGVLKQEETCHIPSLGRGQTRRDQARPVVEKALQASFCPTLALLPECLKRLNGLLLHRWVPEDANPSSVKHQTKTQIQIVSDGVLIETTAGFQQIPAQQLTIAAQFSHSTTGKPSILKLGIKGHLHGLNTG